jgi:endonuclease-3 related protein
MVENSFNLLEALKRAGYLHTTRDPLWWPRSGTQEVVIGAILTQQTKWERVEESLAALNAEGLGSLQALAGAEMEQVVTCIKPSGFYNTKAQRLMQLARNILADFNDFETFQKEVDRAWLLSQKGIGMESADSILCYACHRPVMVVDSYTARLLDALGYTFDDYMQIQAWIEEGIEPHREKVCRLYGYDITPATLYARFHGKIVEFAKEYIRGKRVDISVLSLTVTSQNPI